MRGSVYRRADAVLSFKHQPTFEKTPDGLRAKAYWLEQREAAFQALEKAVRQRVNQVRDRMWRRFDNGGFGQGK